MIERNPILRFTMQPIVQDFISTSRVGVYHYARSKMACTEVWYRAGKTWIVTGCSWGMQRDGSIVYNISLVELKLL